MSIVFRLRYRVVIRTCVVILASCAFYNDRLVEDQENNSPENELVAGKSGGHEKGGGGMFDPVGGTGGVGGGGAVGVSSGGGKAGIAGDTGVSKGNGGQSGDVVGGDDGGGQEAGGGGTGFIDKDSAISRSDGGAVDDAAIGGIGGEIDAGGMEGTGEADSAAGEGGVAGHSDAGGASGEGGVAGQSDSGGASGEGGTAGQSDAGGAAGEGGTAGTVVDGGLGGTGSEGGTGEIDSGDGDGGAGGIDGGAGEGGTGGIDGGLEEICGNGRVTGTETCDTGIAQDMPGACPSECPVPDGCLQYELSGTGCHTECVIVTPECSLFSDDCCPAQCNNPTDPDCPAQCGDGVVQDIEGELCEPSWAFPDPAFICPIECPDDGDPCTQEMLVGNEDNCNAECLPPIIITQLIGGDLCCPVGANANTDSDCFPICGNQVREADEECDGSVGCDDQCHLTITQEQLNCIQDFDVYRDECEFCMCTNCLNQVVECFDSGDSGDIDMHCTNVVDCGYNAHCYGPICYCGTNYLPYLDMCLIGNGPCKTVIEQAAGTTDIITIFSQQSNMNTAVGRSTVVSNCYERNCLDLCL